jgi:hypothetical protein
VRAILQTEGHRIELAIQQSISSQLRAVVDATSDDCVSVGETVRLDPSDSTGEITAFTSATGQGELAGTQIGYTYSKPGS